MRVLIIGGGVMGSALACFLARDHGIAPTVLERDMAGTQASSALSASSIRQQFTTPVNMALSRWSLNFLQQAHTELAVEGEEPALGLVLPGYLYLANEAQASALRQAHASQLAHGAQVALLEPEALRQRFDWLQVQDLALGSLGLQGEGWFDGPALWQAFRHKAKACGAQFVRANASGFKTHAGRVQGVQLLDGRVLQADAVVLCAGAWSATLGLELGLELPIVGAKRDVFFFEAPAQLPQCPLIIEPGGSWLRPEGRGFLCGGPPRDGDPPFAPLHAIDHSLFEELLWPTWAERIPALQALRLRSAWAGYYEMNTFDHNGLAGALPDWANAYVAAGFSGHGMQHAPAVGCALAARLAHELMGQPLATGIADIGALSPMRLVHGQPLHELNVI